MLLIKTWHSRGDNLDDFVAGKLSLLSNLAQIDAQTAWQMEARHNHNQLFMQVLCTTVLQTM